ncbi:MAG TPA: DUF4124 domain-containing protein [Gammaproteobacteria bacterium]|nr:DUF4124 domain-containing protein [Gammaproteobacteria bacterium]
MLKRLHIILALTLLTLSPAWGGKLYKWTDEEGNVHYSDKLPPEAVEQAHQELNSQGLATKKVSREKTKEEKAMEEAAAAAAEAEKKKLAEEAAQQKARDDLLLSTFTTERDLTLARDDRLSSIDSTINMTVNNNASMEQQAEAVRKRIENLKKSNKEVPENVTKQLENIQGQLDKNKSFIQIKQDERRQLEAKFDSDLKRYRELKGITAPVEQQTAAGTQVSPPAPPQATASDTAQKP